MKVKHTGLHIETKQLCEDSRTQQDTGLCMSRRQKRWCSGVIGHSLGSQVCWRSQPSFNQWGGRWLGIHFDSQLPWAHHVEYVCLQEPRVGTCFTGSRSMKWIKARGYCSAVRPWNVESIKASLLGLVTCLLTSDNTFPRFVLAGNLSDVSPRSLQQLRCVCNATQTTWIQSRIFCVDVFGS